MVTGGCQPAVLLLYKRIIMPTLSYLHRADRRKAASKQRELLRVIMGQHGRISG